MNILEVFRMAMGALSANLTRSLLTILAIVVGVFAIISSSTAVAVIDHSLKTTMTLFGGSVVTISTRPAIQTGDNSQYRNRKPLTFDDFEDLRERSVIARAMNPYVRFAYTRVEGNGVISNPDITVFGGNEWWISNNAYDIAEGRDISIDDVVNSRPVAVIGTEIKTKLFGSGSAIGKSIRIDGRYYSVVGMTAEKGSTFGESRDKFVLIPYTRLMSVYGSNRSVVIQAQAPDITLVTETTDEITGNLRTIREVAPGDPSDFEITTNDSLQSSTDELTGVLYIFGLVVGGVALLGAGIGVMNIMLVSVTERTREIGIRKSIGATSKAITQQFLLETIVICQIGGVFGIMAGVAGGNLLAIAMESSAVIPWGSVALGLVGMTVIGLVFGVYPAVKASRLDPIVSLRYE